MNQFRVYKFGHKDLVTLALNHIAAHGGAGIIDSPYIVESFQDATSDYVNGRGLAIAFKDD